MAGRARRSPGFLIFAALFGLAALGMAGLSLVSAARWTGFALRAETLPAVVERVDVTGRRGNVYVPVFRMEAGENRDVLARSHNVNSWRRYAAGQVVRVRRDTADPAWAEGDTLPVLLLGPALGLVVAGLFLGIAWIFTRPSDPHAVPVTTVTHHAWGTTTTRSSGPPLPGGLKLLLAGSGFALAAMIALFFAHGEVREAVARHETSALAEGRIVPRLKEHRLIRGEWVPHHVPALRFTAGDGREVTLDVEQHPALAGHSLGGAVRVRYPRTSPETAVPASLLREWWPSLAAIVALLLVLGLGGWPLRRAAPAWWREARG